MGLQARKVRDPSNYSYRVDDAFVIVQFDADMTMDGTGQAVKLHRQVSNGGGRVYFQNLGATTEAIRIAFGSSSASAVVKLAISASAATAGLYLRAAADGNADVLLGVPVWATHYAVANAVALDTQSVVVTQGL